MKTSKKILIAGVLIAAVSIIRILWGLSSAEAKAVPQPQLSPTPRILENGWYEYTDKEAGYSFSYPPGSLYITSGKDKGEKYNHLSIQFVGIKGNGYQGMVVYLMANPKKYSTEEFLLQDYVGVWTKKTPPTNMSKAELGERLTVGGKSAIKTSLPVYLEIETATYLVFIANNNKIIVTGPMYGLMSASEVVSETESLFRQILETFTFHP